VLVARFAGVGVTHRLKGTVGPGAGGRKPKGGEFAG
jgi:hypothetical protein